MQPNKISAALTAKQVSDAVTALQQITAALGSNLISLTPDERTEMPKMSDKTLAFVTKATNYCESNPEFAPGYLDVQELKKDLQLAADLKIILDQVTQLQRLVEDTMMQAGSEAYIAALVYYNNIRAVARHGAADAVPIYEDLSARFPGRPRGKKPENS